MMQDHLFVDLIEETFATKLGKQTRSSFAGQTGHAAKLLVREGHGERDWQARVCGRVVEVIHPGPVE